MLNLIIYKITWIIFFIKYNTQWRSTLISFMKPVLNNLITVRLSNPNSSKFCDVRFNYSKNKILNTKTFENGKLVEYKHDNGFTKYSPITGLQTISMLDNAKEKVIKTFQKRSNKLKNLFKFNKTNNEKYVAEFDANEKLSSLLIFNTKKNKSTSLKINEAGDIIDIKGDKLDKQIANVKYNKDSAKFEFRTNKQIKKTPYGIESSETLYIDNLNGVSKKYLTFTDPSKSSKPLYAGVETSIEKNGKQQLIEDVIYEPETNEIILHEIIDSNDKCVYRAVRSTYEDGSKTYGLVGDYNNGKTIDIKRPDRL